jgi:zinc transport system ATP-binding protein
MKEIVRVNEVNLVTSSDTILKDITFRINKGDYLGIIGPNGGGKTTLIKIMLGLIRPTSGQVFLFGKNIEGFREWHKIGYVPQKATSFDHNFPSTVEEIVAMGALARKKFPKFLNSKDKKEIESFLKKVGMYEQRDKRIGDLSGGQQQRVFIARTLVSKPELLILDEPTTGVDKQTQDKFYDFIGQLNKKEKLTIIIITHDISYITKHVSKVACLSQKLLFHGSHDEFCSSHIIDKVLRHDNHFVCHDKHEV